MRFTLRVDLDYVPWDTPDAEEFGHGEPATTLRLLEMAQQSGAKWHFFASNRVFRAFRESVTVIRDQGHSVAWLCKRPDEWTVRSAEAIEHLESLRLPADGFAIKSAWPIDVATPPSLLPFRYLCAHAGPAPSGLTLYPLTAQTDREAYLRGKSAHTWASEWKSALRSSASRAQDVTFAVRPQVLAKFDPGLEELRQVVQLALGLEFHAAPLPWAHPET